MSNLKKLIIACDGESASGKSTAAKMISKKYKLLLINSGLNYRYCSKRVIIKFFQAGLETASYRRWLDIRKKVPLNEVKSSLKRRTMLDKKRKNSPLIRVKDAILVRSDQLNKQQVLLKMSKAIDKIFKN